MFRKSAGGRARALVALAATLVATLAMAVPTAASAGPADLEAQFVAKINELRASKGLQPLLVDGELTQIGRNWAAKMAAAGQISHNPNFRNEVTSDWQRLGENVGVGPTVDSLFKAFVDSPGHYANLVHASYNRVGVGVVMAGDTIYTAHQFMELRGAAPAAVPPPTAAPAPKATPAPAPAPRRAQTTTARPLPAPAPAAAAAAAAPAPAPAPPAHLVGVLEQLHQLDQQ